jgi:alpha-glucuronidase
MKRNICSLVFTIFTLATINLVNAGDGYRLWLRYDLITDADLLNEYRDEIQAIMIDGESATLQAARDELKNGLSGLLGTTIPEVDNVNKDGIVMAGAFDNFPQLKDANLKSRLLKAGDEGFVIATEKISGKNVIVITANSDIGVLYGVFHFLKLLQTHQAISNPGIVSAPKIKLRMLNHWDRLDGTRVYHGFSIWDWPTLPHFIKQRYVDYARANASIGINGTVPNIVNAEPEFITHQYLVKVAALADVFRPYGIRMFLSANFDSPKLLAGLKTSDPYDPQVKEWWKNKAKEINSLIPDFGGFLVKANSEGEPGPQDYGKSQADGCNLLAEALKPYNGIVIWRAFVYDYNPRDRAREAYDIFKPLDGKFADNAMLQVKHGPLDFQPREPFSPLFGAMPNTSLVMELDPGQGAFGEDIDLNYLAPMWEECFKSDTYSKGKGSTVAKIIDGSIENYKMTGIAGVSNINAERNWGSNIFAQANWYAFGRMGWDHSLTSEQIADEWIRMTFSNDTSIVNPIKKIMMTSRENVVNFMDPLGLSMMRGWGEHCGPWVNNSEHADWNSPYYHRADSLGIGFDRTITGSNAVEQYYPPVAQKFSSLETCPEEYLLWFHHLPWTYKMLSGTKSRPAGKSGNTLWDELCCHYYKGVEGVREMQNIWDSLQGKIVAERKSRPGGIDEEEFYNVPDKCISIRIMEKLNFPDSLNHLSVSQIAGKCIRSAKL